MNSSKNKEILIIDFDDSFTLNIASEFYQIGLKSEVINVKNFFKGFKSSPTDILNYDHFVLGPGPGHPEDYFRQHELSEFFKFLFDRPGKTLLGVCLGHQLLGCFLGYSIIDSKEKKHGEVVRYQVNKGDLLFPKSLYGKALELQRYNSLCLQGNTAIKLTNIFEGLDENGEVIGLKGKNFISYQFHPESVGTFYRKQIFYYIRENLYNWSNE